MIMNKRNKRILAFFTTILISLSWMFSGICFAEQKNEEYTGSVHWQDYIGKRIGTITGTPLETIATENFKGSTILYFNNYSDLSAALLSGNIDAYIADEAQIKTVHYEQPLISYIPEHFTSADYAFAFRKNDTKSAALCAEFNDFLAEIKSDGTLAKMEEIWLGVDETLKVVDMSGLTGKNGSINIATTSTDMPWSYIKNNKNVGYDIDLIVRFCRERGYSLKITDVDFAGRIPAVQSGKCDFSTDMNVTPERKEQVLFSDPTAGGGAVLAVKSSDLEKATATSEENAPQFTTFEELNGKTISLMTGAPFQNIISSKVKNVKEFTYYQTMPDMILGVKSGRTDAGLLNNEVAEYSINRDSSLAIFPESLGDSTFGLGFAKGDERAKLWQKTYDSIPQAKKDELWNKWTGADESKKTVPVQDWDGKNGTVTVAACDSLVPASYMNTEGELLGLDIETILIIAKELDIHVDFIPMDFSAVLASLSAGKADIICGSIIVSDERRETMDFVEYQPASLVLLVRSENGSSKDIPTDTLASSSSIDAKGDGNKSFFNSLKNSFERTFIREDRYKLFGWGMVTTMLITVFSVIFGTILGFLSFMMCRKGNKAANTVIGFLRWLIGGMPVVVLLMILYYIIFAKSHISGAFVSVIAFSLVFGSSVFAMIRTGVGAVDRGQTEAALSLGYGDIHSFFRIILPQALPHFLPQYKAEIVALIKATAVVGYIAVQDLTKMGDIVRGRTYEAFFPLIAVAVIYFILAGILTFIVGKLEIKINPKMRKRESILKGVNTDDRA